MRRVEKTAHRRNQVSTRATPQHSNQHESRGYKWLSHPQGKDPADPESAPILMLYIMYNMAQRLPAGIRRDLSGDLGKAGLHMQHIRRAGHGANPKSSVRGEPLASFNTMSL